MDSGRTGVSLDWILQDRSRTLADTELERIVSSITRQPEHELKATIKEQAVIHGVIDQGENG